MEAVVRVDAVEMADASRQVRTGCFDRQMIVIDHQVVRVAQPPTEIDHLGQNLKECNTIRIAEEDLLTGVSPGRDVVVGPFVFNPRWVCHAASLHQPIPTIKTRPFGDLCSTEYPAVR